MKQRELQFSIFNNKSGTQQDSCVPEVISTLMKKGGKLIQNEAKLSNKDVARKMTRNSSELKRKFCFEVLFPFLFVAPCRLAIFVPNCF